jgi:hypothetical protein
MSQIAEAQKDEDTEGHPKGPKPKREFEIEVIYNGIPKELKVRLEESIKQVLDRAIQLFSPLPQPHTLSLYNAAGKELNDADTVESAGIHPKDRLLLRPSQVKGG